MRLAGGIELEAVPANEGMSEVVIEGRHTGQLVAGRVLEAAVECGPGWLLFVTDDVPAEEMLAIHLLDRVPRLLDSAWIGGPYTTGAFRDLRLEPPATACFRFVDDVEWSVRVHDVPRAALPWWPDARGVWRGRRWTRHFEVRRRASN